MKIRLLRFLLVVSVTCLIATAVSIIAIASWLVLRYRSATYAEAFDRRLRAHRLRQRLEDAISSLTAAYSILGEYTKGA